MNRTCIAKKFPEGMPLNTTLSRDSQSKLRRNVRSFSLAQRRYLLAAALLAPVVLLRLFTTLYPFLQTTFLSTQKYNPAFPPQKFVGLGNFERLFGDIVVQQSLVFTIIFVFVSTFFQLILGLAVAHLLNAPFRLRGIARSISLIPWAIPMVVAAIGFRWMFDDQFGMIPDILRRVFGLETTWLINPQNARLAVVLVNIWKSTPFVALVLLAGMQGISQDQYEAAKVDGATWHQTLRFITFPMLLPIIVSISMYMLVWQLAVFDLPFAMTGGGPGFSTTVIAQKIFQEINTLNYGYAAALGVVMVFVVAIIGGIGLYIFRRVEVSD
jgi:multiple sugar transport system permease protein